MHRKMEKTNLTLSKSRLAPEWDQHFNTRTTFKANTIGFNPGFNEEYENKMIDKHDILDDQAI
jgi:hypothetical protein